MITSVIIVKYSAITKALKVIVEICKKDSSKK